MIIEIWWSKILANSKAQPFKDFCQQMANRLIQGETRYGSGCKEQKYMTRLSLELKAYKRTGNREQLLNIANYCLLESMFPENKKFHYDSNADSVTRGKVK